MFDGDHDDLSSEYETEMEPNGPDPSTIPDEVLLSSADRVWLASIHIDP